MAMLNDCSIFKVHNDYYTPKSAWENINHLIPKDKIIWEACMFKSYQSKSPQYLRELGHDVVFNHQWDMLKDKPNIFDIIITNPPFENKIKKDILYELIKLDKPFIILLNSMNTFTKYIRDIFKSNLKDLQIIIPFGKINYEKLDYETNELQPTTNCSFYCIYLCYKMRFTQEQLWLL